MGVTPDGLPRTMLLESTIYSLTDYKIPPQVRRDCHWGRGRRGPELTKGRYRWESYILNQEDMDTKLPAN